MKKIVVLVSGMDSLVALQKAKLEFPDDEVFGVYYDMGMAYSEYEKSALPRGVRVRAFRGYTDMLRETNIEGYRCYDELYEGMLYDVIRVYKPDVLWLGVLFTDSQRFTDNSLAWLEYFDTKFPYTEIDYPLARMGLGKKGVIEYGLSIGLEAEHMLSMYQCRSDFGGEKGCGSCFSCMRKKSTFEELGFETSIPSPKELPTSLLAKELCDFADASRAMRVSGGMNDYMQEVLPLLEKTYEVSNNIFVLSDTVAAYYVANKHRIAKLMEDKGD